MATRDPVFPFPSGSLALAFLNTRRGTGEGRGQQSVTADLLASPADMIAWLLAAGEAPLGEACQAALASPPAAKLLFTEAQHLRGTLGRLVHAFARREPLPDHALFALNRVLGAGPRTVRVQVGPPGPALEDGAIAGLGAWEATAARLWPLAPLVPVALAAARLLTTADPDRLRVCAAEGCAAWFLDTSKGGRRRWCSMDRCGNREKAARHRRRAAPNNA